MKRCMEWMIVFSLLLMMNLAGTAAQDGENISLDFTFYEDNPVLTRGADGEWDSFTIMPGCVLYHDGLFHMLYSGSDDPLGSITGSARSATSDNETVTSGGTYEIGYATSEDGFNWIKYEHNPVFRVDETLYTNGIMGGPCYVENVQWIIYAHPMFTTQYKPDYQVVRLVSEDPTGPWTIGEMVLDMSENERIRGMEADVVLQMDDEYVMYYSHWPFAQYYEDFGIGLATSPDGSQFTPYVDSETGNYSIFSLPNIVMYGTDVLKTEDGWEMFYAFTELLDSGGQTPWGIGYATSEDGMSWTPQFDEPFLVNDLEIWWPHVVIVDSVYYVYYATHHGRSDLQEIALATGTIADAND